MANTTIEKPKDNKIKVILKKKYKSFKLIEFNVKDYNIQKSCAYNSDSDSDASSDSDDIGNNRYSKSNKKQFMIQMFGINEQGKTCSIVVNDYCPFFYIKVTNNWSIEKKNLFLEHIKNNVGKYLENNIVDFKLIKRKKLYGFDAGTTYKFIIIKMTTMQTFYKVRNLWYHNGIYNKFYKYNNEKLELYESNIPPLLRFFHIKNISPSGWISLHDKYLVHDTKQMGETTCQYEYNVSYKNIVSLNDKETSVPYKICSFDIEASSSHGDFPLPIKSYRKVADNIIYGIENNKEIIKENTEQYKLFLIDALRKAFGFDNNNNNKFYLDNIENVYLKTQFDEKEFELKIKELFEIKLEKNSNENRVIEDMFNKKVNNNIISLLKNKLLHNSDKIDKLNNILSQVFPKVKGDKVTFIGSTFTNFGENQPYLNHCVTLNTCDDLPELENSQIDAYKTEKQVLLAWTKLIQKEDPDIIIGYNIFGFDYIFMFKRALENNCVEDFLKMSRNKNELCGKKDYITEKISIEESSIVIASGQHDLSYVKMNGRLQIDLYNYFRRSCNLEQYKLDYVSGHFIGDYVKGIESEENVDVLHNIFKVKSKNLTGLKKYDYVCFEIISHSVDKFNKGEKFKILDMQILGHESYFIIQGSSLNELQKIKDKIRWGITKDDVTPQDIFRLTNEGSKERSIVAKYCIQDCNLVYELFKKIDIITEFIEMSKLCSVPINFLVFRGQGIKLTSYIAKKCREKGTLIPVIEKCTNNEGYEGAIVLPPKCNLYLEDPIACVDYSSLYPSSMISENLCHSSKVWTKEYDLNNNLLKETGDIKFDNLPDYKYVDITYDTFCYIRKTPSAATTKVKIGYKICRFAQYKEGKAILPSVLQELLSARKETKKQKAQENDPFMKNIYDKRQISIKLTANSLYGQTGATTSSFYEPDVAASTTAIGRKMLTYAKRLIEEVYGDNICETKNYGKVRTKAQYIYGDTDSVFFCFYLQKMDGTPIKNKKALEITIELAQEVGELASKFLKNPHDLEYEKTFLPFCLLSKKRYVGMLYEEDSNVGYRKSMGIVLKRRDNAPIVKDIYGGIIDILMKEKNVKKSIEFLNKSLDDIVNEKCDMNKLIITKSLRSEYKNPKQIAHKVLADRMAERDPGNKPKSGDRIPFAYIVNKNKKALQGNKIEAPSYILDNNIKLDYAHYITNQIMKPVTQIYALVLYELPGFKNKFGKIKRFERELKSQKEKLSEEKYKKKEEQLKNKEVKCLLFDYYLNICNKNSNNIKTIDTFFSIK